MNEDIHKELQALQGMVVAWKQSYLQSALEGGGGEFLALELLEEIDQQVYPYARRLLQCDYLTQAEVDRFMDFCYGQVEELRAACGENTPGGH